MKRRIEEPYNYIKHTHRCGKYAPMVSHKTNQCLDPVDPATINNKIGVYVYYVDQTRSPLAWQFPIENMEAAIDIARLYSQDKNVLNVICDCYEFRIATFAGYWEGRKYE